MAINSFPIPTKKTSELSTVTTVPATAFFPHLETELKKITARNLINQLLEHLNYETATSATALSLEAGSGFLHELDMTGATIDDRAVTVDPDVSVLVFNSGALDLLVEGEDCDAVTLSTGEAALLIYANDKHLPTPLKHTADTDDLTTTLTDFADDDDYYYGGEHSSGAWQINKFTKYALVKTSAAESNNSGVTTLAAAWTDRTDLNYA